MKRVVILVLSFLFVFSLYGSSNDGIGEAKSASLRLLKQIEGCIAQFDKVKNKEQLDKLQQQFKKAQDNFVKDIFALYKKYPALQNETSFPALKKISSKIDIAMKKYQQLHSQRQAAFNAMKTGRSGLAKKQVETLVCALFNKVSSDLDMARSGKQAGRVVISFVEEIKKMKKLYSNMDLKMTSSAKLKKATMRFMNSLMQVAMKYQKDEDFKKALQRLKELR